MSQVARSESEPRLADDPRARLSHPDALYEIVDGEVVEKPEMGWLATLVSQRLYAELLFYSRDHPIGVAYHKAMFIVDPDRPLRRRPEVAFVSVDRCPPDRKVPPEGDCDVVPTVAVEVISPNDLYEPVTAKIREYFRYGVRQVWLIEPNNRRIAAYSSPTQFREVEEGEVFEAGEILPGFRIETDRLFRDTAG